MSEMMKVFIVCILLLKESTCFDTSITSTGCWPEWTPIGDNCYLAVVTSQLLRNSARSACKRWDWDGDVDLASLWYYSHWNDVKLLLQNAAAGTSAASVWLGSSWYKKGARSWSDGSDYGYYTWHSEEDQNREDTLYYVAMRVADGKYISLEGSETTDGYICKTARTFLWEMGVPWMDPYPANTTFAERLEKNETSVQSGYFFKQFNVDQVLEKSTQLSFYSSLWNDLHCVSRCIETTDCVYALVRCKIWEKCGYVTCSLRSMMTV